MAFTNGFRTNPSARKPAELDFFNPLSGQLRFLLVCSGLPDGQQSPQLGGFLLVTERAERYEVGQIVLATLHN